MTFLPSAERSQFVEYTALFLGWLLPGPSPVSIVHSNDAQVNQIIGQLFASNPETILRQITQQLLNQRQIR